MNQSWSDPTSLVARCLVAAVLLLIMTHAPKAHADPWNTCMEDGGQAECMRPDQGPPSYSAQIPGIGVGSFDSESALEAGIDIGYCTQSQSPTPSYTWSVSSVSADASVSWTTTIVQDYVAISSGTCSMSGVNNWIATKTSALSCRVGWATSSSTSTAYPFGSCQRVAVQRCQNGQCTQAVGDPIDTADGNETEQELDFSGGGLTHLAFQRTYNYRGTITGPGTPQGSVGEGWSHSYDRRLWFYPGGAVRALRPDGNHKVFLPSGSGFQEVGTAVDQLIAVGGSSSPTGWTLISADDTRESYDTSGNLLSITYRGGEVLTMSYSTTSTSSSIAPTPGLLIAVADAYGHQLSLVYNGAGEITSLTDPGGATYTYSYSGSLLSNVTYPDATTRQYLYNESAHTGGASIPYALTGILDESGTRYATIGWNSAAQAVSSSLAGGVDQYTLTSINYSGYYGYGLTYLTDPLGANHIATYSAGNGVGKFSGINTFCSICGDTPASVSYDTNGNVASRTDFNGNQVTYGYDTTRNLETSRTEAYGSSIARTISTSWDSAWRQPDTVTEPRRTITYTYDSMGNVLTRTVTDTTATPNVSRVWTYTYDGNGRVLTAKGPRTDLDSTTTYTYYTCTTGTHCGRLHTLTDALGNVTTYNTYDGDGQPLTITDSNGTVTTLTYDAEERLTTRQVGSETTSFSYYATGLLDQITLPDGSTLQYTYDNAHRLTAISDGAGNSIQYTLDAIGNYTAESAYDPTSTLSRTQSRIYNSLNQLYQQIGASGTSAVTTTFGYDSQGNQTSIAAPLTRSTSNTYDALNRLGQVTDPLSGIAHFTYDAADDLTAVEDPLGLTTSYGYNGFGDVSSLSSPATGSSANTYDSGGNLASSVDARSKTASYSYDALNRVRQVAYGDQTIAYTYDAGTYGKGRLTGASDSAHSMSWQYDAQGRVTSKSQTVNSVTQAVGYAYTNGDLTTLTTPSGQTVTYTYTNHRIHSISINGTALLGSVTYEPFGPTRGWSWANGATESRVYDTDGNPSVFTATESTSYTVDSAFRIVGMSNASNSALSWTDTYDKLDRLTSGAQTSTSLSWTYDADGNRLSAAGAVAPAYASSSLTMTYNNRGRMASSTAGGATTYYTYNALGQRIAKSGHIALLYWYDEAGHLLGEYTSSGALVQETIWMGDVPVATIQPDAVSGVDVYYIHSDHLNTPQMITRPSDSAIMWRWDQDPFGIAAPNQNPGGLGTLSYNLRFPGQYFDTETNFNYNYFRDYDSQVGRYVESDPIGLAGGSASTYAYTNDNPISRIDPRGLADSCPTCKQGFLDCLANCIRKYDPLNGSGKAALTVLGASIPKAWFDLPVQGSPYTTLPSALSLGQGTAAAGVNVLRIVGRVSNVGYLLYGNYLAGMEVVCAAQCLGNNCAH